MPEQEVTAYKGLSFPEAAEQLVTGFTVDNIKVVRDNLFVGMTLKDCAALIHIPHRRLNKWWRDNYHGFGELVDEAEALNKQHYLGDVFDAKDSTKLKAAQWVLERKHKDEYTKETIININHQVVDTVGVIAYETLAEFITDPEILELAKDKLISRLQRAKPVVTDIALTTTPHEEA